MHTWPGPPCGATACMVCHIDKNDKARLDSPSEKGAVNFKVTGFGRPISRRNSYLIWPNTSTNA